MRRGILVYISGPITPIYNKELGSLSIEMNVAIGLDAHLELLRLGIPSFCPQMGAILPSCHQLSWQTWIDYDLAILDFCTHILMLPRWTESRGATVERQHMIGVGKPVAYSIPELLDILEKQWVKEKE